MNQFFNKLSRKVVVSLQKNNSDRLARRKLWLKSCKADSPIGNPP